MRRYGGPHGTPIAASSCRRCIDGNDFDGSWQRNHGGGSIDGGASSRATYASQRSAHGRARDESNREADPGGRLQTAPRSNAPEPFPRGRPHCELALLQRRRTRRTQRRLAAAGTPRIGRRDWCRGTSRTAGAWQQSEQSHTRNDGNDNCLVHAGRTRGGRNVYRASWLDVIAEKYLKTGSCLLWR